MKHDPKWNPKPGDVLRSGDEQREYLEGGMRSYNLNEKHTPRLNSRNVSAIAMGDWRKWAKDAEVIHAAD